MKTTRLFATTLMFAIILAVSFTSCRKEKNSDTADPTSLQQLARDEDALEKAQEESMNDVEMVLSQTGLKSTDQLPCNATVDSTQVVNDTITIYITYNGLNCNGTRFRQGKVEIRKHVGTQWYMTGATVMIRHIDFSITRIATNQTIVLNGVKVHKNVTGGVVPQLGHGISTVIHRTRGRMNVTFEDGSVKAWKVARQQTYTGRSPANVVMTVDGFGEEGDYSNLVVWGINRQGELFYTQMIEPVVHRKACDWDPVSGIKKHAIPADSKSATLTFGFNRNNQPINGDECPAKYKLDWHRNNNSGTVYLWL